MSDDAQQLRFDGMGERRIDVKELLDLGAKHYAGIKAPATYKAMDHDWKLFVRWCDEADRKALPASPETVKAYVIDGFRKGLAINTMARRLCTVISLHRNEGVPLPTGPETWEIISAARRHPENNKSSAKHTLTIEELRHISRELAAEGGIRDYRDRAILIFGFASAMRRAELSALDISDLEFGKKGVTVNIRKSKTDQFSVGRKIGIFRGKNPASCAVRTLNAWLDKRGRWGGPLFVRLKPHSQAVTHDRLGPESIHDAVQRSVELIGLQPHKYGGHSLRASCVTAALDTGQTESAVMILTGHKNSATLHRYHRAKDAHAYNVLAKVC